MALPNKTILNLLDALQDQFGPFTRFEDVPSVVLEAEIVSEQPFSIGTSRKQDVAA